MKICDLCLNPVDELDTLKKEYQTLRVNEVCPECMKELLEAVREYERFWDNVKRRNKMTWYWRLLENIKAKRNL